MTQIYAGEHWLDPISPLLTVFNDSLLTNKNDEDPRGISNTPNIKYFSSNQSSGLWDILFSLNVSGFSACDIE